MLKSRRLGRERRPAMTQIVNDISLRVVTTGSAGSATGSASTNVVGGITGFLHSVIVKPTASGWANTTDITVTEVGGAGRTLLTITNKDSALASYPVRVAEVDATGAVSGGFTPPALVGAQIQVSLVQANAQSPAVEVWLQILR